MTLKELGIKFAEALLDRAFSDGYEKIKHQAQRHIQKRKVQNYAATIEKELLSRHGDEVYYGSLSMFLCQSDVLSKIVKRCYDRDIYDFLTDEELVCSLMATFPSHPYNSSRVKEIVTILLRTAFTHFNSDLSDDGRQLKNTILQGLDNVKSTMIEPLRDMNSWLVKLTDLMKKIESPAAMNTTTVDVGVLGKLTQSDIKSFQAGDIKISGFRFNDPGLYATISTRICYDATKYQAQTFNQLISYLRFCGRQQDFKVAEMSIVTNQGSVLFAYKDTNYKGILLSLPDVRINEIAGGIDALQKVISMTVCIAPQIDEFHASIEDEHGNELLAPEVYHIERHIDGNDLIASYICSSDILMADINIDFVFVDRNIENGRTDIKLVPKQGGRISHKLKRLQSLYALSTTDSYGLFNKVNDQNIVMWHSPLVLTGENSLRIIENSIAMYRKMVHIERSLNITFDVDYPYCEDDQYWIDVVDQLLTRDCINYADCILTMARRDTIIPTEDMSKITYLFVASLNVSIGNTMIKFKEMPCLIGRTFKFQSDENTYRVFLHDCKIFLSSATADDVDFQAKRFLEAKKYFNPRFEEAPNDSGFDVSIE
jgi:hypothetical protein